MDCSMLGLPVQYQLPELVSNSCPLSQWCHPTISSSVVPFSSHIQSFPASGSFQVSQFFPSGSQSNWSLSFSMNPSKDIQDWFPLGLTGLISLSPRDSQESSPTPQFKSINSLVVSFLYSPISSSEVPNSNIYYLTYCWPWASLKEVGSRQVSI